MLATPAKIAGCEEIVLCTPPDKEGRVNPAILVAAKVAGVSRIIKAGGIQAIGTTAYDGNVRVTVVGKRLLILGVDAGDVSSVELFDVNGQKVKSDTHISESGIDVSSLPGGVYVAVVCSGGHYSYHKIALR